ncbi:N-acetyltransferase ats1 [Escovopsis weberi]|uniref:N-acetyltransferase ats1 n=1 Tax=Escovopsis weberi TaxID=150374 RepID=A0A0M8N9T7_ESCWE|nr:N-acetyltransferase ats1 [Escovopsis weberi]
MAFTLRHARREDAPIILSLIQDLADYEKEPDAVEATVETLEKTIAFAPSDPETVSPDAASLPVTEPITPNRISRCFLIFNEEGKPAGMALYFYNYSTWRSKPGIHLEDLFVKPSERGKGYGKTLLAALAKEVIAMDGGRLEWVVLKWNKPSIDFYHSIGAQALDEWVGMRVDGEALVKLADLGNNN